MIWLQRIVCSSNFIANFAFHPTHIWAALALNLLLAVSCLGLLLTVLRRQGAEQVSSKLEGHNGNVARNIIVIALTLLCLVASLAKLNGTSTALWKSVDDGGDRTVLQCTCMHK